jgi:glutamine synthetase
MEQGLQPPQEITEDIFSMDACTRDGHQIKTLPNSLEKAVQLMQEDQLICDTLGEHVLKQYVLGKQKEWEEYNTRVSSWEIEKYLISY